MARCLSVYRTSEAVSVRPSVTRRYFVETAKHIIEVFPPSDSQTILVFCTKLRRGPERRIQWVMKNHNFRPISQFISEMMRDKAIYGRLIGNCIQAFEWYQFGWPSVTYNPDFKFTIIQRQIIRKWCNIHVDLYLGLQWPTNRKSYYDLSNIERPPLPVSRSRHLLTLNIWETIRDTDSFNGMLIQTLTPDSPVSFRTTLSDLAKYSMTGEARGVSATNELFVNSVMC